MTTPTQKSGCLSTRQAQSATCILSVLALLLQSATLSGCSEQGLPVVCDPGETQMCLCASGLKGAQACRNDRKGWLECVCQGESSDVVLGWDTTPCSPNCVGLECGDDGCGGECGNCQDGQSCAQGVCASQNGCGDGNCEPGETLESCPEDCICVAKCQDKTCGNDGCGGSCGTCTRDQVCDAGQCVETCVGTCVSKGWECGEVCGETCGQCPTQHFCDEGICICSPNCGDNECGQDGCGGYCGACPSSDECIQGQCVCQPGCQGKDCGQDGCGGSCGQCIDGTVCDGGQCVETCTSSCASKGWECGEVCGVPCGTCDAQEVCIEGQCLCQPDCLGKACGADGCGGVCGICSGQNMCVDGQCVCQPACVGKECGSDGCGGLCGMCFGQEQCVNGQCVCQPDCLGKNCGSDGCGGICGTCLGSEEVCVEGSCVCEPNCAGSECGDGGCSDIPDVCGTCLGAETCLDGKCGGAGCWPNCAGMVDIPGGNFWMGCNEWVDDECFDDEYPYHEVSVPDFEIDITEATVSEYSACVQAGVCSEPENMSDDDCNYAKWGRENHPINCVDWYQASQFCEWGGKRLCSEAEWEKAARGGCGLYPDEVWCEVVMPKYPWGNELETCDLAVAWGIADCQWEHTQEVGSKPNGSSPYGVLDMIGNVQEWVADCPHESYEGAPTDGSVWTLEYEISTRVARGGGYWFVGPYLRASCRFAGFTDSGSSDTGVRCCKDL